MEKKETKDDPMVKGTLQDETSRGKNKACKLVVKGTRQDASSSTSKGRCNKNTTTSSAAIEMGNIPIWFTLIALKKQDTNAPLLQIPTRYLRVKNGNFQVSYVQKYIAIKLGLESENEVELYLRNLPLDPSMMLFDLLQHWIATTGGGKIISTSVGCSAAKYIMDLSYGRKPKPVA